jgi:glycosyltransferase involved in cell wall biosynthesis
VLIAFDARPLQGAGSARGIGRYAAELLRALGKMAPELEFLFIVRAGAPRPSGLKGRFLMLSVRVPERLQGYSDALVLGRILAQTEARAYHSVEYAMPWRSPIPTLVSVHDLVPWTVRHRSYLRQRLRWASQVRLLRRADRLLCNSGHTRDTILERLKVEPARTEVVYPGVSEIFMQPAPAAGKEAMHRRFGSFVLMVGECDWRKRPEHTIATLARLREPFRLVITGPNGRHQRRLEAVAAAHGVADRLELTGVLHDAELASAYAAARLLLFPSRAEGFGLPVLEAAAQRLPVVAYANTALPEICGDAFPLVADGDLDAFSARAQELLDHADESAIEAGAARARSFTWARTAEQVLKSYESLGR